MPDTQGGGLPQPSSPSGCSTCVYANLSIDDDNQPYMRCHRYPPVVILLDDEPTQTFPTVFEDQWCGEHQDIHSTEQTP